MKTTDILGRGYFPKEFPPSFSTTSLAAAVGAGTVQVPQSAPSTVTLRHNLARVGSLRRGLGVPNPLSHHCVAEFTSTNWASLQAAAAASGFSMSRPKAAPGVRRAIVPTHPFAEWPLVRVRTRPGRRYLLRADINLFYSSIYTHCVPWALHTKLLAKAQQHDKTLIGNELDRLLRNLNDKQTIGIPIGPDISLLVAELLLSSVDALLGPIRLQSGARYLDDYEFSFTTLSEAEQGLADLQGALSEFELALNPAKCILEELPRPLEAPWVSDLRSFRLAERGRKQGNDLVSFFTKAFVLARTYPQEPVLRYAVGRVAALKMAPTSFRLYESLLLQTASGEAGTLPGVVAELAKYAAAGAPLDRSAVASTLSSIVVVHAPMAHGSEVAWALWGAILLGIRFDAIAEAAVSLMTDSVVAILALDAQRRSLFSPALDVSRWATIAADPAELLGPHWLLAYEARVKGWLPSGSGGLNPYFTVLQNAGVSFYDSTQVPLPTPSAPAATPPAASAPSPGFSEFDDSDWEAYNQWLAEQDDADNDEVVEGYT